jgi:hypothetical protein
MFSLCLNITCFLLTILKVPKWEIFDLLDFCYFYINRRLGDYITHFLKILRGYIHLVVKIAFPFAQLIFKEIFFYVVTTSICIV